MRPWRRDVNTGRGCRCCGASSVRVDVPAPTKDEPDATVKVCPTCDLWPEKNEGRRT